MKASANGIEIEYEALGRPEHPPMLLIMGLGSQMILWDDDFCRLLVERGFRVIRFDNRDVGLSTKIHAAGRPDVVEAFLARQAGRPVPAPYTLADMAGDTVGLLDALRIVAAHVVGVSMGGMIGQEMAIGHPTRVLSLASLMSTTGEPGLPGPTPEATAVLLEPPPRDRAAYIDRTLRVYRVIGSRGFPFDEPWICERAARSFDRSFYPVGFARQLVAIWAAGGRRAALGGVRVPTAVVHGREDPLIPLPCGLDTAAAIAGARLTVIDGMGHDLPRGAWPQIVEAIATNAQSNS